MIEPVDYIKLESLKAVSSVVWSTGMAPCRVIYGEQMVRLLVNSFVERV